MSNKRECQAGGADRNVTAEPEASHHEELIFSPANTAYSPVRMLLFLVLTIFLAEVVVMGILHTVVPNIQPTVEAFVDSAVLVLLVFPAVYVAIFRPMRRTIDQLHSQKEALKSSRQTIEHTETQRDNLEVLNQVFRHDIRNNLQVMTSYLNALEQHIDEDTGREHLDAINESANEAITLTETAGSLADTMLQPHVEHESVHLDHVVDEAVVDVRDVLDADIHVEDSLPNTEVRANSLLKSVFRNLLTNAIRHNDKDEPEITIRAEEGDETVRVQVADNGPGVPDDQKSKIFGRGEKGLGSPGTGLGLYLVDTLVDSCDGDVWVEDNEPEGSVFVVELPTIS